MQLQRHAFKTQAVAGNTQFSFTELNAEKNIPSLLII